MDFGSEPRCASFLNLLISPNLWREIKVIINIFVIERIMIQPFNFIGVIPKNITIMTVLGNENYDELNYPMKELWMFISGDRYLLGNRNQQA